MQIERQVVFWIVALAVFVGLLWVLKAILLPFALGAVIAYVADPLATRLTKLGLGRGVAAFIILGGVLLILAILSRLLAPVLWSQIQAIIADPQQIERGFVDFGNKLTPLYLKTMGLLHLDAKPDDISQALHQGVQKLGGFLTSLLNGAFLASILEKAKSLVSGITLLIITLVVAFYLICDWDRMLDALDGLIPLQHRDTVRGLCRDIDTTLSSYVRGQSAVCAILGCYYALVLALFHVKFWLLIGVVSGLLSFIPYVGSVTALAASIGCALVQTDPEISWRGIAGIAIVVAAGPFAEGAVLSPKLVGHSVGLNPVWLLFALFAFGYLFNYVGLILAVPLAATVSVLVRFAVRRYRESPIYTGQGPA